MKKLMISLCALCLAGLASAQVDGTPRRERMQRPQKQAVVSFVESANLGLQTAESTPARKAETGGLDSVSTQSLYGGAGVSENTFLFMPYPWQNDENTFDPCTENKIRWSYGTGGDPTAAGSGEIGYRFATGPDTYYGIAGYFPNLGIPFAVRTALFRVPSTSLRHTAEDGTVYYDSMPLYFKLYNSTKVGAQVVYGANNDYVDVVYPTDPEDYTAISETVMVPAFCDSAGETDIFYTPKAEFLNVDETQPLGNDFCVSIMFPIEWDEEGDSVIDPSWNATLLILGTENHKDKVSEEAHCVYLVHDFERTTNYWVDARPADGKRWDELVLNPETQPNKRYAILPMDLSENKGEPYLKVYYTEWSALQSANKADRYVQVSPVPAVDYVNFSSYADMSRIEIYSLGGQLVKAVNVSGDTYRMDLTGMNSGMYVARIFSEKGVSSKKLIVR